MGLGGTGPGGTRPGATGLGATEWRLQGWGHWAGDAQRLGGRGAKGGWQPPVIPSAPQEVPCSGRRCLGSLVLPRTLPAPVPEGERTPPELLALARDFVTQYYGSLRR